MAQAMLVVPSKKSEKTQFTPQLKKYIKLSYKTEPEMYDEDFKTLEALREDALSAATVEAHTKYLAQLQYLGAKFPISEKGVKILFCWFHAFNVKQRAGLPNVNFEKAAILFNLGALYSQQAKKQNLASNDGLKVAFNQYQSAAGVYLYLRDVLKEWFSQSPSSDLSVASVKSLEVVMLAQAQECFYLKAVNDAKGDALLAKLAGQVADLYDQAYDAAVAEGAKTPLDEKQEWLVHMQVKALYYNGVAQIKQSYVDLAADRYAEEITRLQTAFGLLSKALDLAKHIPAIHGDIRTYLNYAQQRLPKAIKDNDLIYHYAIPTLKSIPPIGRHLMVKSTPVSWEKDARPLFANLIPIGVHKAAEDYFKVKSGLVQQHLTRLDTALTSLSSSLVEMNLPAAIDALEQPIGLPQRILDQAAEVRSEGGARSIADLLDSIFASSQRCSLTLDQALKQLEEEEQQDKEHRQQFGSRWVRTPSATLTENLRQEATLLRRTLEQASAADAKVRETLIANRPGIESFSGSVDDLERSIPSSISANTPVSTNVEMRSVKALLDQLPALKAEFDAVAAALKATADMDDIVTYLMEKGEDVSTEQQQLAMQQRIKDKYEEHIKAITAVIEKQERLLALIQENNKKFVASKKSNEIISGRETALRNLDVAYNAFKELSNNTKEALKFYDDMDNALKAFIGKCSDYCFARKTEMKDLLTDIQVAATGASIKQFQQPAYAPQAWASPGARFDPSTGQPLMTNFGGPFAGASAPPANSSSFSHYPNAFYNF